MDVKNILTNLWVLHPLVMIFARGFAAVVTVRVFGTHVAGDVVVNVIIVVVNVAIWRLLVGVVLLIVRRGWHVWTLKFVFRFLRSIWCVWLWVLLREKCLGIVDCQWKDLILKSLPACRLRRRVCLLRVDGWVCHHVAGAGTRWEGVACFLLRKKKKKKS